MSSPKYTTHSEKIEMMNHELTDQTHYFFRRQLEILNSIQNNLRM